MSAAQAAPATSPEAITVGNYQLVQKLGEGGMGAVFKGVDLMVEREVAIKMLRPEIARQPGIVERFHAEAVALAKLNHPHIATLYSFFRDGEQYFMVMEFVKGRTLESMLRQSRQIAVGQAVAIASQVLAAIEHAHSLGILHRDIKPANIMLTEQGQVKVTDFGIARLLGTARMTREGCLCGTLEYLAPERIRGVEADLRSDLYSTGVVLYEMLSGRLPFQAGNEFELMRAHLEKPAPTFAALGVRAIPERLEAAVAKALAKAPEDRFATAGEFRAALAGEERQQAATGPAPESWPFQPRPTVAGTPKAAAETRPAIASAKTSRLRWTAYTALAVAALLGLILAFSRIGKPATSEATKPQPATVVAPVVTQPSAPNSPAQTAGAQGSQQQSANSPANGAESAVTNAGKPKPDSAAGRRKAALRALDKDASGAGKKTDKPRDRRSSSLEALKQ